MKMSKRNKKIQEIMKNVDSTLETVEFGYNYVMSKNPLKRLAGLKNVVVFGRAVTNVLQNLRSAWKDFDKWYEPYRNEMKNDPLLRYFYKLRSEILKEGKLKTTSATHIKGLMLPQDLQRLPPPPIGTKSFFMGDNIGGSGWEVELPDGTKEKFYVEIPKDLAEISMIFPTPPTHHLGKKIQDTSIEALCKVYLDYLNKMVADAKQKMYVPK